MEQQIDNNIELISGEEDIERDQKEQLKSVLIILKEAADEIRPMQEELPKLDQSKQPEERRENLEKMAEIIINLPTELKPEIDGVREDVKKEIIKEVNEFAQKAVEAKDAVGTFPLAELLITNNQKTIEEPNDLEKYIKELENKYLEAEDKVEDKKEAA